MDKTPQDGNVYAIGCPHALQEYVGCNDETAKTLARLAYEIATDYEIRKALQTPSGFFQILRKPGPFNDWTLLLYEYDISATVKMGRLNLIRYNRPLTALDKRSKAALERYRLEVGRVSAIIPLEIADIIRAFGEFADLKIRQDVVDACCGFYNDPSVGCDVCRAKYGTS